MTLAVRTLPETADLKYDLQKYTSTDWAGNSAAESKHFLSAVYQNALVAFSALTLLVGRQEGHPACEKWGMVVGSGVEWRLSQTICVSASVNLPLYHVQKFSSGTGSPGWSRKKGHKTVVVWWCSDVYQNPTLKPKSTENNYYYYYIRLVAFFQDNLGKPAPER